MWVEDEAPKIEDEDIRDIRLNSEFTEQEEEIKQKAEVLPLIPASYCCSITELIMFDPVFTADGYTFEREAIEDWLKDHDTSPKTGVKLKSKELTPNWDKKGDISDFLNKYPAFYESKEVYFPRSLKIQLVDAIKKNKMNEVRDCLSKDRRLLTLPLERGYAAFHLACEYGSPQLVQMLLEQLHDKKKINKMIIQPPGFKPIHLNSLLQQILEAKSGGKGDANITPDMLMNLGAKLAQSARIEHLEATIVGSVSNDQNKTLTSSNPEKKGQPEQEQSPFKITAEKGSSVIFSQKNMQTGHKNSLFTPTTAADTHAQAFAETKPPAMPVFANQDEKRNQKIEEARAALKSIPSIYTSRGISDTERERISKERIALFKNLSKEEINKRNYYLTTLLKSKESFVHNSGGFASRETTYEIGNIREIMVLSQVSSDVIPLSLRKT